MFGKPPDVVPDGLAAKEYLELGLWYIESRMLNLARESLTRAIDLEPKSAAAAESKRLLETRIPRSQVPQEAIDQVMRGEHQLMLHPQEAKKIATKLIADYPEFERPHRLMADYHLRRGDVQRCIASLETALKINPQYAGASALMARALAVDMEYDAARQHLQKALAAMPQDAELRSLERSLEFLVSLDEDEV